MTKKLLVKLFLKLTILECLAILMFPTALRTLGPLWWWLIQFHFPSWHWKIHEYLQCEKRYSHGLALKLDLELYDLLFCYFCKKVFSMVCYKNCANTFYILERSSNVWIIMNSYIILFQIVSPIQIFSLSSRTCIL